LLADDSPLGYSKDIEEAPLYGRFLASYDGTNRRRAKDIWEEPNAGPLLADVFH